MRSNDYGLLKEKFREKSVELQEEYQDIEAMLNIIKQSQFESKLENGILPAFIIYFAITFLSLNSNFMTNFSNILSPYFLPIIQIISTIVTGIISSKIIDRKNNTKNKLEEITNAKIEKEKYIEEIKYTINFKKKLQRFKIVYNAHSILHNELTELLKISKKYNVIEKEERLTKSELAEKIALNKQELETKYKELDLLITEHTIADKFARVRAVGQAFIDIIFSIGLGGTFTMFTSFASLLGFMSIPTKVTLISFIFGALSTTLYTLYRRKILKEAFDSLNEDLLENKIIPKRDNIKGELDLLKEKIIELSKEIINKEIEIEKQQIKLNNLTTQTTNLRKTRILPRKEIISNNLPKRKILGIKKLENKRYN